jgi:peroxiredoxin Q/BCP
VSLSLRAGRGFTTPHATTRHGATRPTTGHYLYDMTQRLQPGDTAPEFDLPTADGGRVNLKALRGRKVILYAYPSAMTPGCTKQACDFEESLASFSEEGYQIVGISPDKPEKLAKFIERDSLTFPLMSDVDKSVLTAYGAFGEKKNYGKIVQGVIRSTFVIDEESKIEVAQYNVRATGHVAKLRRDLKLA